MTTQRYSAALVFLLLPFWAFCQTDIPINTWRVHPSFYSIHSIALQSDRRVFAASAHGVLTIERSDNALTTHTTLDGLKGSKITTIAYDNTTNGLVIAYEDGTFDLMDSDSQLINFDPTASSNFSGSKRINSVAIFSSLTYLSTDYGVVVFDLSKRQIKETWRDLSETGAAFKIYGSTVMRDSIFLATERGVIAGSLNANLQDFSNWKRFNTGTFNASIKLITSFNDVVYCAIDHDGIYSLRGALWMIEPFLAGEDFLSLTSSVTSLIVTTLNGVWSVPESAVPLALENDLITSPQFAIEDQLGKVWIADAGSGLVTESSGNYEGYLPNSPARDLMAGMSYHDQRMFAFSGGYSSSGDPLKNIGGIDVYNAGSWSNVVTSVSDITSVLAGPSAGEFYIASFGQGVEVSGAGGTQKIWDETNSSMTNVAPPQKSVNVTALAFSDAGLWVTNYGSPQPLHLLKPDQTWDAFSFNTSPSRYITKLQTDLLGNVWMLIDPAHGGGVMIFNKENNTSRYLTEIEGQGGLPGRNVYSIALDRDGLVWVGTDLGAAYFNVSASIFSSPVNAIKPVVDGRFLLRDDRVSAIAVDGGNRKWFGTQRGVWLYATEGDLALNYFNATTTPLPSDIVIDIRCNDANGEVFFVTSEGLASYRSGATTAGALALKVFPNPVFPGFSGTVGISGTPEDAIIKITDVSGKLVWQGRANGGTATWNVQDDKGRRVPTGIYVVFVVTDDGDQRLAAKIAVVD